jgi:hypothetical protein
MKTLVGASTATVTIQSTAFKAVLGTTLGDPNSEILSISSTKDISQPSGSFQIELVPRLDSSKTWFDKLGVWDYVEIRFKGVKDDKEKLVMRGFIDSISKQENFEPTEPVRKIIISGRDLGCLLTDFSLYYVPEWGKNEAIRSYLKVLAWAIDRTKILSCNAQEAFEFLMDEFLSQMDLMIAGISNYKYIEELIDYHAECFWPTMRTNLLFLMTYEGAWWNAFQEYQDKPFHELFTYDTEEDTKFILRPSRLKDAKGNFAPVVEKLKSDEIMYPYPNGFSIDAVEKISEVLSKSINELYTFYFCLPFQQLLSKEEFRSVAVDPDVKDPRQLVNPYATVDPGSPSYIKKFGFRKLEASTCFVMLDPGQLEKKNIGKEYQTQVVFPEFISRGKEMNKTLVAWYAHNPLLVSGQIEITGTNRPLIGTYVKDFGASPLPMEYYVEGVSHTFVQLQSFRTSLRVTRGQPVTGLASVEGEAVNDFYFGKDSVETRSGVKL